MTRADNQSSTERGWFRAAIGLLVLIGLLQWLVYDHYGMGWDEAYRLSKGEAIIEFYQGLFAAESIPAYLAEYGGSRYPGLFDLLFALLADEWGEEAFLIQHRLIAIFAFVGYAGVMMLGRQVGGWRVAFFSLLVLATIPRFWGHGFFNPKDIPFAALHVWTLFWGLRMIQRPTGMTWGNALGFGACLGLSMGVRTGGLVAVGYLGLFWLASLYWDYGTWRDRRRCFIQGAAKLVAAGMLALMLVALVWPRAFSRPFGAIETNVTHYGQSSWAGRILFMGDLIPAVELPPYYYPMMLAITIPLIYWGFLAGGLIAGWSRRRRTGWRFGPEGRGVVWVLFAAAFPPAYIVARSILVYDGIRHILFALPPFAVAVAWSIGCFARWVDQGKAKRTLKLGLAGLAGLVWCGLVIDMMRLHPYEYIYYNQLVGGARGATGKFENDYWGTSYRDAVAALEAYLAANGLAGQPVYVGASSEDLLAKTFFPENFQYSEDPRAVDFVLTIDRADFRLPLGGKVIYAIKRDGVPLNLILDRREMKQRLLEDRQINEANE